MHVHGQLCTYNSNMYIVDQRNPKSMLWVDGNGAVLYGGGGRLGHGVGIERHRRGRIGTGWPAVQLAGCPAERRRVAQLCSYQKFLLQLREAEKKSPAMQLAQLRERGLLNAQLGCQLVAIERLGNWSVVLTFCE